MDSIASILNVKTDYPIGAIPARPTTPMIADENQTVPTTLTRRIEAEKIDPPKTTTPKPNNDNLDLETIKKSIHSIRDQLEAVIRALDGLPEPIIGGRAGTATESDLVLATGEKILEGVFNGEKMIGEDGAEYAVPPNYASKSKLVEGDIMKLTIGRNGSFIYKQIKPIERKKILGVLAYDLESKKWSATHENRHYKILTASISFYKGKIGDEVVIILPEIGRSDWAAVDNIISK